MYINEFLSNHIQFCTDYLLIKEEDIIRYLQKENIEHRSYSIQNDKKEVVFTNNSFLYKITFSCINDTYISGKQHVIINQDIRSMLVENFTNEFGPSPHVPILQWEFNIYDCMFSFQAGTSNGNLVSSCHASYISNEYLHDFIFTCLNKQQEEGIQKRINTQKRYGCHSETSIFHLLLCFIIFEKESSNLDTYQTNRIINNSIIYFNKLKYFQDKKDLKTSINKSLNLINSNRALIDSMKQQWIDSEFTLIFKI